MAGHDIKGDELSFEDVDTSENAKIHVVVGTLSPMKKGKSAEFFEGTITDGTTEMRVVGFKGSHRKRLADFQKCESVAVSKLQDKKGSII